MADLSKIKVGDKLRLEVTVTGIDDSEMPIDVIVGDDEDFWPHTWIEAAEHIPAPRVFKRGDWVRTRPEIDSQTGGIVTWVMSGGSTVRVHWPSNISEERLTADLEPDEAPE